MKDEEEDEESLVEIDEYNLDKEWIRQPKLVRRFARLVADARNEVAEAKAALDVAKAEAALAIRDNPEEYGIKKATESQVEAAVLLTEVVQKAQRRYNKARHRLDLLEATLTALEHKKRALESLVSLHGQSYFAEPRTDSKSREGMQETTKRKARRPIKTAEGE